MNRITPIFYVISFALTILINFLSGYIPFNGNTQQVLSAKYFTLFIPDGFAFSIWGIIYVLLGIFVIKVCYDFYWKNENLISTYKKIFPLFLINMILNMLWLVVWHYEYVNLSLLIMVGLLISLIGIYRIGLKEPYKMKVAFSVYLGWICVATIVNFSVVIAYNWVNQPADYIWTTVIMMGVGLALIMFVLIKFKDAAWVLATGWGILFIGIKHNDILPLFYSGISIFIIMSLTIIFLRLRGVKFYE